MYNDGNCRNKNYVFCYIWNNRRRGTSFLCNIQNKFWSKWKQFQIRKNCFFSWSMARPYWYRMASSTRIICNRFRRYIWCRTWRKQTKIFMAFRTSKWLYICSYCRRTWICRMLNYNDIIWNSNMERCTNCYESSWYIWKLISSWNS